MELYDEVVEVKRKPKIENRTHADNSGQGKAILEQIDDLDKTTTKRPASSLPRNVKPSDRAHSESESSDTGTDDNAKIAVDGFDYRIWESLDLPKDVKDLYQFIAR